ncbi:MAG: acyltransferase [Chitinophagaceae bacterium]|nr:acyltransferase [Chitinophagaceae bacterium]
MKQTSKIYLPNLNTLRAVAALMVVISHIELKKSILGLGGLSTLKNWGTIGVSLFFVLSGFLITYLLMVEKENFKTINVKDFYLRRILRIWPLYFLVIAFVYVLIPYILPAYYQSEPERFTLTSVLYNVFFLTNFSLVLKLTPVIISNIWSIGIEEQFYIFWPWVMKQKEKTYTKLILLVIFIIPIGKLCTMLLNHWLHSDQIRIASKIITTTRIDCMAIGAFFGVLGYRKNIQLFRFNLNYAVFTTRWVQVLCYSIVLSTFIIAQFTTRLDLFFNFALYPWLFAIIILNLSTNPNTLFNLENKITNYIGVISYSIYLNHMLVMYLWFPFIKPYISTLTPMIQNIIIYPSTLMLVFLVSHITYNYFEKQFLKLKKKFAHVNT